MRHQRPGWFFRCPVCDEEHEFSPRDCGRDEAHAICPETGERVTVGAEHTYHRPPPVEGEPLRDE
jgi:hypothetical protein